jgi:ribosomal protein S18 acetylase RimI-like enzyme
MERLRIKSVTIADLDLLQEISVSTFKANYGHLNEPENLQLHLVQNLSQEQLAAELHHPQMMFFFGLVGNQLAAYTKLNVGNGQTEDYGHDHLEVERIYVRDQQQGKGYGRQMLEHAVSVAQSLKKSFVWLGVWEKNPRAVQFYKHLGFAVMGTHTFTVGNDPQTDFVMKLRL